MPMLRERSANGRAVENGAHMRTSVLRAMRRETGKHSGQLRLFGNLQRDDDSERDNDEGLSTGDQLKTSLSLLYSLPYSRMFSNKLIQP